jgi:hypothetical protein
MKTLDEKEFLDQLYSGEIELVPPDDENISVKVEGPYYGSQVTLYGRYTSKHEEPNYNIMIKIKGKNFHCECGGNVFSKPKPISQPDIFVCNSCETKYSAQ